ncbi:MAG TPA: FtsX-like permease family protein, partial [Acidobacteria bacterium]|nr:FtsX-like permease family protein [Acidobacteriota bacterium]
DVVGKVVELGGSPFTVIGVLRPKEQDSAYSGRDHSKLVIPESTFRALTGRRYLDDFIYRAERPELNAGLTRKIREALARRMHFDPTDDQAIQVWNTTEMFEFFDTFMLAFNAFLGFMGLLTLVVGGIGVSNIMNVVVDERTREIGIKMALGAKGRTILLQFLAETLVLTAVGGVSGLVIAAGICRIVSELGLDKTIGNPVLSPGIAVLTTVALGLIGFVAGYFPARDAARLDPVVAMKV